MRLSAGFRAAHLAGVLFAASAAGRASAVAYNFASISPGASAANMMTGETQFTMDVTDAGAGMVLFTIQNSGANASSVHAIYWDDADDLLDSITMILDDPTDVEFGEGGAPPVLPDGNLISFDEDFRVTAAVPQPFRGINPGEELGVKFNLEFGFGFSDVLNRLNSGELRVGLHAIAFADQGSASFVSTGVVPLPSAALLGAAAASVVGARRRRRDAF